MSTKTDPDKFFQMRVNEKFVADLDELRVRERPVPTRAEMIRMLVARATADLALRIRRSGD